jgi:hypothetical protein
MLATPVQDFRLQAQFHCMIDHLESNSLTITEKQHRQSGAASVAVPPHPLTMFLLTPSAGMLGYILAGYG